MQNVYSKQRKETGVGMQRGPCLMGREVRVLDGGMVVGSFGGSRSPTPPCENPKIKCIKSTYML